MTEILALRSIADIGQLAEAWDRLRSRQVWFFPDFDDLRSYLEEEPRRFVLVAAREDGAISCIACFVCQQAYKKYTLGERRLFNLPIREARLFGSGVLGTLDPHTFSRFVDIVRHEFSFDVLSLGEIACGSDLHAAVQAAGTGLLATSPERKESVRWLIHLPDTFEDYVASLGTESRQSVRRKLRNFERRYGREFHVVRRPEQVDAFLRAGEAVSSLTYQWNVGQRLCNDESTRRRYLRLAERGKLRCYLLHAEGKPCAFLRGQLSGTVFHYETPGFDPAYAKASPGTVALMWALKDLIEDTSCEVFDFGQGGDETGYKSRFGTVAMKARALQLSHRFRLYPLFVIGVQEGLTAAKNAASWALGDSELRKRLRRLVRKHGART